MPVHLLLPQPGRRGLLRALLLPVLLLVLLPASSQPLQAEGEGFRVLNDEYLGEQWGLFNWGQTIGAEYTTAADVDIRAPEAWAITTGSREVVVAVIDTGVDYEHPDLMANMWRNPGESGDGKESNGLDDDGNGFVDDAHGWDFFDDDNDPRDELSKVQDGDSIGHGTAVASVIGAVGDNGIGLSGVAPEVSLVALRVAGEGAVSSSATADAVDYAAAMGAHVVNISLGSAIPLLPNTQLDEAIARHPDILFVVTAGNQGNDVDIIGLDPCAQEHDHLVCVAATDWQDELAEWIDTRGGSNWGATTVDLAAPGGLIATALPPTTYVFEDDFEGPLDETRWTTNGDWSTEGGHLVDSPGGVHTAEEPSWIATLEAVDLTEQQGCYLEIEGFSAELAGIVRLESSRDGDPDTRWTIHGGRSGFSSVGTRGEIEAHAVPLALGEPRYLRLAIDPQVSDTRPAADGVSFDAIRIACLADEHGDLDYGYVQGTSFAAPHVSGAAALLLSAYPDLGPLELKQALMDGTAPLESLDGHVVSGGRLDVFGALQAAEALVSANPIETPRDARAQLGASAQLAGAGIAVPFGTAGSPPPTRGGAGGAAAGADSGDAGPSGAAAGGEGGGAEGAGSGGGQAADGGASDEGGGGETTSELNAPDPGGFNWLLALAMSGGLTAAGWAALKAKSKFTKQQQAQIEAAVLAHGSPGVQGEGSAGIISEQSVEPIVITKDGIKGSYTEKAGVGGSGKLSGSAGGVKAELAGDVLLGTEFGTAVTGDIGPDGAHFGAEMSASAGLGGSVSGSLSTGGAEVTGIVDAFVGAEVEAEGSLNVGPDGVSAGVNAEAFVGGKVGTEVTASYGGIELSGEAAATYGAGGELGANLEITAEKIALSADLGASLGLGFDTGVDISVNTKEFSEHMASAFNWE